MSNSEWTVPLDGSSEISKELVGGKAKSIADMQALGLTVPPAFAITTRACLAYLENGAMPAGLEEEVSRNLALLEEKIGRSFGRGERRLLLSVRSGAAISMPGMMDTVLNLGIDDEAEAALAAETGLADFARDTHRRFIELYANIVLKQPVEAENGPAAARAELAALDVAMPTTVHDQLFGAIRAVFDSWNTRRAKRYRQHANIPDSLGTAVTIQAMVFGNLDERSGTGVLFSRNPLTGDKSPYGEYLPRAQGEDVVSGKFTPLPLDAMKDSDSEAYDALMAASTLLENHHHDVQDIEFTVQSGKLYLLQSRSAKRAPQAALRFAVDMVDEGHIDVATALSRVTADQVAAVLRPRLSSSAADAEQIARGEGACPGAASGILVADSEEAEKHAARGEDVILVRKTTSPDDVHGMIAARGVVTEQGGSTSHAAVVSRALGRPCVVGVGDGMVARVGQPVTIDGEKGVVFAGKLPTEIPDEDADPWLGRLMSWVAPDIRAKVLPDVDAAEADAIDVDAILATGSQDDLDQALAGKSAVRGRSLGNPDIVRIARRCGIDRYYASPMLPAMLVLQEDA